MFQTAELGQKVSRSEFKQQELILRENLLALQQRLRSEGGFPVILDFAGVRGAGKDTSTNLVFEGPDAGGKGGAIRQITQALDAH